MKLLKPLLSVVILLFILNISAQNRPNVILIMADDMGWGDTHYNGHSVIKTPYLDAMASEGIQFNRFYSASPVCSPTRASFLTGRHPHRTGVFTANRGILRPEEITISEVLQGVGYSTGHFGKWHLGTMTHTESDANRGEPGNTQEYNPPVLHGYDKVFATESKVPTYDPMIKPGTTSTPFGTAFWDENNNKVTDNLSGDASKVVMDRVLPFIDGAKSNDKPFLAVVWFHAPHKPVVAGPTHLAMYNGQTTAKKHYYGCITAMDEQIGRLRDHLQTLGIADNTIITFCSDNGPEDGTPGITKGYKERKRSLYEGGVRVPSVMVWPEKITQQIITNEPFGTSDYFPTILDILDIDLPSDRSYDGESFLPLINDSNFKRDNGIGFAFQHINWSNSNTLEDQLSYQTFKYKLYAKDEVFELYNIKNDPYETNDLAGDSSYSVILNDMIEAYKVWLQSVKDSFDGEEYGTTSYDRMGQVFVSPLTITLSTNDFNDAFSNIVVYPNPSTDTINIRAAKRIDKVEFINLLGQKSLSVSVNALKKQIDISNLQSGTYIMEIKINGIIGSYRFVKE